MHVVGGSFLVSDATCLVLFPLSCIAGKVLLLYLCVLPRNDSAKGEPALGFPGHFNVVSTFIFFLSTFAFTRSVWCCFTLFPRVFGTAYKYSDLMCHFHILCCSPLNLCSPFSTADNGRAKECQSDGRRFSSGQDAGRTRSAFAR